MISNKTIKQFFQEMRQYEKIRIMSYIKSIPIKHRQLEQKKTVMRAPDLLKIGY